MADVQRHIPETHTAWEQGAFCVSVSGKGAGGAPTSPLGPCPVASDSKTCPEQMSKSAHAVCTAAFLCAQALGFVWGQGHSRLCPPLGQPTSLHPVFQEKAQISKGLKHQPWTYSSEVMHRVSKTHECDHHHQGPLTWPTVRDSWKGWGSLR